MALLKALAAGAAGSAVLTLVHEAARQVLPEAPRADILGVRAIERGLFAVGQQPPTGDELHQIALGMDLVANAGYYSLAALGGHQRSLMTGSLLGLVGGLAGITLPGPLGLGEAPTERSSQTRAMTVAWYTLGGLVAGLAYWLLSFPIPADRLDQTL